MADNGRMSQWTIAACVLVSCLVANAVHAQALGADTRFLAMDLFGGTHPEASTATGPEKPAGTFGWEIASTVRFARWIGVTAAVGRVRTPERAWITHVQAGPRVSHTLGRITDVRGFAHVMAGRAASELRSGLTDTSLEIMAGGGIDVFNVFRFQLDVVRRDLDAFPKNNGRFLFGVTLPLCFRGCTPADGFHVGR